MAVKTITIDMKAYEALRRHKREGQSFSAVIKEHFCAGPTGRVLKRSLENLRLSESTLDALDRVVEDRSEDSPRVPEL
jgi:predicted CopG family antitoxin